MNCCMTLLTVKMEIPMKKSILLLALLSSFTSFASEDCFSNKELDRKATAAKYLSTVGFGSGQCEDLEQMLSGELCEDVELETLNYAKEVLNYICD